MENIVYYGMCVVAVIIGFWLIKRVVSCLFRSFILLALIAIIAYIYFGYIGIS